MVKIGTDRDAYYASNELAFKVAGESTQDYFIFARIVVQGKIVDKRNRTDPSLPDPLSLKITLEQVNGQTTSLEVVHRVCLFFKMFCFCFISYLFSIFI